MPLDSFRRALRCRWLTAWLVLVVTLQGVASGARAVEGHSHAHRATGHLERLDFRRELPSRKEAARGLSAWFGHAQAHVLAERHHHAPADPSVLHSAEDASPDGAASGLAFLALASACAEWRSARLGHPCPCGTLWISTTRYAARIERPPRAG